jgi:hypothetical protein
VAAKIFQNLERCIACTGLSFSPHHALQGEPAKGVSVARMEKSGQCCGGAGRQDLRGIEG